jgi:hypothetical protein
MPILDGISSGGAKYLGFDGKEAKYKVQGSDVLLNGEQFIAHVLEATGGYIKFKGKEEQPDRHMAPVFPEDQSPNRDDLDENDASKWPPGKFSKEPEDPWRLRLEIPIEHAETGEQYTFVAMSKTALGAVKDLLNQCRRLPPGYEPRISLNVGVFKSKFGPVKKPVLRITGKVESSGNGHAKEEEQDLPFDDSPEF